SARRDRWLFPCTADQLKKEKRHVSPFLVARPNFSSWYARPNITPTFGDTLPAATGSAGDPRPAVDLLRGHGSGPDRRHQRGQQGRRGEHHRPHGTGHVPLRLDGGE